MPSDMDATYTGGCRCGRVKLSAGGEPLRVGICHCTDCRSESGSPFTFYGVWPARAFGHTGPTLEFRGQHFCAECGSPLFSVDAHEAEVKLGALSSAPTGLTPGYELWVKSREPWLRQVEGAAQYEEDRG
jgi:hypothetical protein